MFIDKFINPVGHEGNFEDESDEMLREQGIIPDDDAEIEEEEEEGEELVGEGMEKFVLDFNS